MSKVRVLVVDDSPSMRGLLKSVLGKEPDIDVVGTASNPHEARDAVKRLNPDVMTLDVEMPGMSGIEFLRRVMRLRPMPVVMVSTLTTKGAAVAVEALSIGAFDCVAKPNAANPDSLHDLADIVRAAKQSATFANHGPQERRDAVQLQPTDRPIVVGSSTGGVEALEVMFSSFVPTCPPVLVVQHMPASFTRSLSRRFDAALAPAVVEAEDGMKLKPGTIYIAPGGDRHMSISDKRNPHISLRTGPKVSGHQPSVDVLFKSAVSIWGSECVGVLLTGMGADGAEGLKMLRDAGAKTFAQDEATCVVFGMPAAAARLGAVDDLTPLSWMASAVGRASSYAHENSQRKRA